MIDDDFTIMMRSWHTHTPSRFLCICP